MVEMLEMEVDLYTGTLKSVQTGKSYSLEFIDIGFISEEEEGGLPGARKINAAREEERKKVGGADAFFISDRYEREVSRGYSLSLHMVFYKSSEARQDVEDYMAWQKGLGDATKKRDELKSELRFAALEDGDITDLRSNYRTAVGVVEDFEKRDPRVGWTKNLENVKFS